MRKMTFTLDDSTARYLDRASERLGMPKSQVVREAVQLYGEQLGRLSDEEREERLRVFDELVGRLPTRSQADVDAELAALREARRGGGRRGSPAGLRRNEEDGS